ncbi:MAG: ABC transporter ATP-binding protein [Planctomycetota bacterium]
MPDSRDSIRVLPTAAPEEMDQLPQVPFWSTLWGLMGRYRRKVTLAVICAMLVGVAVAVQQNLIVKWIVDEGILRKAADGTPAPAEERWQYALGYVVLFLVVSVLRMAIWLAGYRGMLRSIEGMLCRLRGRFFRHVQRLCLRFHDQVSSGELFNYIMGTPLNSLKTFLQQFSMNVPYQAVAWVVAVGFLASFNVLMTLITVGVMLVVILINFRSRLIIREISSDFMATESSVSKYVADMLQGCRAVKVYAMEDDASLSFDLQVERIREKGLHLAFRQQIEHLKPEAVQYAGQAVVYLTGAYFCIYRDLTAGEYFAFVVSFQLLMAPVMAMLQLNLLRGNAEAGLDRIFRILRVAESTPEAPPADRVEVDAQAERARAEGRPCVAFEAVRFGYRDGTPVFDGLDLQIPDGQSVALVGASGSGKSTFLSLLLRLYEVDEGRILLNGADVRQYAIQDLRACFGVVPQSPFLFQATILDNVRVTAPDATDAEVREAMELAQMTEFVDEMPQKAHTWLGEGGFNLSGGQRQRLAIARAVLGRPRYFIFDEATSALDNRSEKQVQAAMEHLMGGHTTFVIAHRLSTIRNVDRVLVFDHGRVVQDGPYHALAERDGPFRTLLAEADGGALPG